MRSRLALSLQAIANSIAAPESRELLVIGAHLFGDDDNDPLQRHVRSVPWGRVTLLEASPNIAQQLAARVASANPFSQTPLPSVAVRNLGVCLEAEAKSLPFYAFDETRGLPPWSSQIGSFNRSRVEAAVHDLMAVASPSAGWTRASLRARIQPRPVQCLGFGSALAGGAATDRADPAHARPTPAVVLIDTEGFDCALVASVDWCALPFTVDLLIFEVRHCSESALRAARTALSRPCQQSHAGPALRRRGDLELAAARSGRREGPGRQNTYYTSPRLAKVAVLDKNATRCASRKGPN